MKSKVSKRTLFNIFESFLATSKWNFTHSKINYEKLPFWTIFIFVGDFLFWTFFGVWKHTTFWFKFLMITWISDNYSKMGAAFTCNKPQTHSFNIFNHSVNYYYYLSSLSSIWSSKYVQKVVRWGNFACPSWR